MSRKFVTGWIAAALVILAVPVPGWTACKLTQYASVQLAYAPSGALLVPVRLNEHEAWMALTMSTGVAMISPRVLDQFGLKAWRLEQDNIKSNGVRVEQQTSVSSLHIGNANFADWILYVYPGEGQPTPMINGKPLIGNISARFMNVVDVELDLANLKMNLFKQSTCGDESVYWSRQFAKAKLYTDPSGLVLFPMELDGEKVETSLNTVGPRSRLSEVVARSHFKFDRSSPGVIMDGAPAGVANMGHKNMSLTAKGIALNNVPVHLYDDNRRQCLPIRGGTQSGAVGFRNCFGVVPFEIGTEMLRQLRIYIASKQERIYFTRAATAGEQVDMQALPAR